jgi:SAM-dependent methyltransferase
MHEQAYLDGSYLDRVPSWHAADSPWKAEQCKALLLELGVVPKSICDVGCGAGGVLAALKDTFPAADLVGFDISPVAINLARQSHTEIEFTTGGAIGHFDLMLVMDVVEHVEDCFGFTRGLRQHADLVLFNIPLELTCWGLLRNVLMAHRQALGHIHYFTRHTALALLNDCGFDILTARYAPAVVDLARRDLKTRAVTTMQRTGFRLAPNLSVVAVGGYSLLVAARPSS